VKLFAVLAKLNNLNTSSITRVDASASTYNALVALGQVDFIIGTVNRFPELQPLASQNKVTLGEFTFVQYGLDIYGDALVTSTDMIQNHPDIVGNFVQASLRSVQDAAEDPQAAVASVIHYNPQLNFSLSLLDFKAEVAYTLPPDVNSTKNPLTLGWTDPVKMQQTSDTVLEGYGIGPGFNATAIYTNQFVLSPQG
jgi:NitT/TauT family transport system substrate-binding protein